MNIKRKQQLSNYIFILPMVILFLGLVVYPLIYNIIISFYEWNGISIEKTFNGIQNYAAVIKEPVFIKILFNFVVFALVCIVVQAFFGLIFASFFIRKIKCSGIYRILFYLPVIATSTIVGNVFSKIFETNRGYLNEFLRMVGLDSLCQEWIADPKLALACIIFVNIWQWTGYSMLMYYANMLNIPESLFEAATMDGASSVQQFTHITFPLLRGTHYTLFVMGVLGSLKCFDIPFVLTKGGPNYSTEFFSTYIYTKSFDLFKQGEASALTVIMLVIALIITAVQLKLYFRDDKDKELAG